MQAVSDIKELGREGEEVAARFMERMGFRILGRNYRCRYGEIDLIAEKQETIYFIEVKTRRSSEAVSPLELISPVKKRHISRVAQYYLTRCRGKEVSGDFGLVVVDGENFSCEWFEGIFDLAWGY